MRHIGNPMAWHVSRQRLVGRNTGEKEKTEVVMRETKSYIAAEHKLFDLMFSESNLVVLLYFNKHSLFFCFYIYIVLLGSYHQPSKEEQFNLSSLLYQQNQWFSLHEQEVLPGRFKEGKKLFIVSYTLISLHFILNSVKQKHPIKTCSQTHPSKQCHVMKKQWNVFDLLLQEKNKNISSPLFGFNPDPSL